MTKFAAMRSVLRTLAWTAKGLVVLGVSVLGIGAGWAEPPAVSYLVPLAVNPGAETVVELHGENLAGPTGLWTSMPAGVAPAAEFAQRADAVAYKLQVPPDAPPGIAALRVATGQGVSNLKLLLVDDMPTLLDPGRNHAPDQARPLVRSVAVEGACQPQQWSYFKLTVAAGETLALEVMARRLGSPLDPVLRLLDAEGRELAYNDDTPGLAGDACLAYRAPAAGELVIALRDVAYQGGPRYRFRLRVGSFPVAAVPFPLGVHRGQAASIAVLGDGPAASPVSLAAPSEPGPTMLQFAAASGSTPGSALLRVAVSDIDELIEPASGDATLECTPPCAISGRLSQPSEVDIYHITVRGGQQLVLFPQSQRFFSPADLRLQLTSPSGAALINTDKIGPGEQELRVTFPADGTYELSVGDLYRGGGPRHVYRVEVRPEPPGFALTVDRDQLNTPQQGNAAVVVKATRRGYDGPITLAVEGMAEPTGLRNEVIEKEKSETRLLIALPPELTAGSLRTLRIVGTATIDGRPYRAVASAAAAIRAEYPLMVNLPPPLDETLSLGVGPVFPPFFKLALEPAEPVFPAAGGAATFTVKATRENKFAGAIELAVEGLPDGYQAQADPVAQGKNETKITVSGPALAAELSLRLVGSAAYLDQDGSAVLTAVVRPVAAPKVTIEPAGPLTVGGKQKLVARLVRAGGEKGPVGLALENLPQGVQAPEKLSFVEGAAELEIELSAAADAPPAKVTNLVAAATATIGGGQVTVRSPAVMLEVVKP